MRKRGFKAASVGGAVALMLTGGIAWAAIPGADGVIQACYDSRGNIKVVAALPCPRGFTPLAWNQQGPAGTDGAPGESAYQTWLDLGNTGTEQDFLDSIQGPAGADGADGNLALAGQNCQEGQFLTGFDQSGDIVCGQAGAVDSGHLYWANGAPVGSATIGRADRDGQNADGSFIHFLTAPPTALAVDSDHIYWSSALTGRIGRANLDGQNVDQAFITDLSGPWGVAVDSGHIYWAGDAGIGRADLDGQNVDQSFITVSPDSGATGVAVDSAHIYWANGATGTIGRADLSGQDVDQSFVTGASEPYGVAVDSGHIYWANRATGTIGRADLSGQNVDQSFVTGASGPLGLAVDSSHIYWANNTAHTIGRADLNVNQNLLIDEPIFPIGVAVDSG